MYSDTDSVHLLGELDPKYIGDKLGQMKLEGVAVDAVYLALPSFARGPKVYSLIMEDGSQICKIKGSKKSLSHELMKSLLIKGSEQSIPQERWKRSLSDGQITLLAESAYTLALRSKQQKKENESTMIKEFL